MEVREFTSIDEDLLQEIGRLRVEAWRTEVPEAGDMPVWIDEFDPEARHWAIFDHGILVAAARLSLHSHLGEVPDAESYAGLFTAPLPSPIGSLNRLVVHPAARGHGLSKRLDQRRLAAADQAGCRSVILSTASGPRRVAQLQGCGFELIGYGPPFRKPPLCYLPPPAVLLFRFPRHGPGIQDPVEGTALFAG
jgi:GNAT superfamily N-acetyltransferase